jgi:hypothetical protein
VAAYVAGLLPLLPQDWEIEVFTETAGGADAAPARLAGRPVHAMESWSARSAAAPFDLNIYQVGNSQAHLSMLPYVVQHPGLLVLHDAILHPARATAFLAADDIPAYREALDCADPALGATIAEVVAAGLGGPSLYWNAPLCEDLIRASRHTLVHGELLAQWLRAQLPPGASVGSAPLWLPVPAATAGAVAGWRERVGASAAIPLLGTFGYMGTEHRVDLLLETLEKLAVDFDFRVVVVGPCRAENGLEAATMAGPLAGRLHLTDRVDDDDFGALLRAVDLGVNLRYPTARAASGPLAQMLSVGTPAVIHDLVHLRDIPEPAVLRVPTGTRDEEARALGAVLREWLGDAALRSEAAVAAANWGAREVTPEALRAGYETAVRHALAGPRVA